MRAFHATITDSPGFDPGMIFMYSSKGMVEDEDEEEPGTITTRSCCIKSSRNPLLRLIIINNLQTPRYQNVQAVLYATRSDGIIGTIARNVQPYINTQFWDGTQRCIEYIPASV